MTSVLTVTKTLSSDDAPTEYSAVFCIDSVADDLERDEFEARFGTFGNFDLPSETGFPLYRLFWNQFTYSVGHHNDINLVKLSILAERLDARVERTQPSEIRCHDLSPKFEAVVADVAAMHGISTDASTRITPVKRLWNYVFAVVGLVPFFLDELFSMVWKHVTGLPSETGTVFVPSVGRFDSMRPVLEAADFEFEVVVSPMTVALLRPGTDFSEIKQFDPTAFSQFVTAEVILEQVLLLHRLFRELVTVRTMETAFETRLYEETGVHLNATVAYSMDTVFDAGHLRDILYFPLTERMIDRMEPENLVVGSGAPFGMSVLAAGQTRGLNQYHLPHGITPPLRGTRMVDVTEFVAGDLDYRYITEKEYVEDTSKYAVTGHPRLGRMKSQATDTEDADGRPGPLRITIATRPYDDEVRATLVEQVLVATANTDTEIVVKTHPTESVQFYEDRFGDRDIVVTDSDLHEHLRAADLVVMITSNVGLEALLHGTPCVSINFWTPDIFVQPYVSESDIPVLRTPTSVETFFRDCSPDTLADRQTRQLESILGNYVFTGAAENIVSYVRDES